MGSRDCCSPHMLVGFTGAAAGVFHGSRHAGVESERWCPDLTPQLAVVELMETPMYDWHMVRATP